jgi:hypothetical protein
MEDLAVSYEARVKGFTSGFPPLPDMYPHLRKTIIVCKKIDKNRLFTVLLCFSYYYNKSRRGGCRK